MYKDIASILQSEVDNINKKKSYKKSYKAKFTVSYLLDDCMERTEDFSHKIILTVNRANVISRSRVIFPKSKAVNYINLEEEMEYLLNSTL